MDISIYLARVFGLYLVVACVAMFLNRKYVSRVAKDFADNLGLVFFSGFIHLFLGLLVVVAHNVWSWDFRGVVTLIGWMGIFKGTLRIFYPAKFIKLGEEFASGKKLIIWGVVWLAVGIYLMWAGFSA
ncbi:MAG TPA: hypothetical protein VJ046_00415 [Candidatus Paceibacterota bacterium]|nr:hypothetical protein [Candidatus Paceibacterota bacterium]